MPATRRLFSLAVICALLAAQPPAGTAGTANAGASHSALDSGALIDNKTNAEKFFPESKLPRALQRRLASRILGKEQLPDLEARDYLRRVAMQLQPADDHFITMSDDAGVNAFAYIGGLVVVFRGLWEFIENEDGFIGVVAHELAHVKLDHVQKSIENAEKVSTIAAPILIAGLLVDDADTRNALISGSSGLISSGIISYSRELEHEADIYALDMMLNAERNGWEMAKVFARLGVSGDEYLSTHPAADRRGAYLADRLHGLTPPPAATAPDYYLLREKFARRNKILESQYQKTARATLAKAVSDRQRLQARYGLLLSATKTRNAALGEEMAAALMASAHSNNPIIARALARNLRQRKRHADAVALLQAAIKRHPDRLALFQELFAAYERLGRHAQTLKTYRALPARARISPELALQAGKAAAHLKRRVLSNYLLALGQAHNGEFEQARRQIAIAEKFKDGDVKTITALESLKKQVEHELELLRKQRAAGRG